MTKTLMCTHFTKC